MKFKPGDKVSFLNERRDGIVKKVLNNKMVIVEIEEGFEIPVIESDLVKSNPFEDENIPAVNNENPEPENEERFPERFALDDSGTDDKKLKPGFYIAFIPENEEQFLESSFAVYLLNNTSSDALFTYSLMENGKYICTDFDRIDEATALLLTDIDKSGFDKWEHLQFQFVFFKKGYESSKSPQTIELRIKPLRFYKEENYAFLSAIGEKCFLIPFSEKEKQEPEECPHTGQVWKEEQWKNEKIMKLPGLKIVGHINDLQKPAAFPEKHLTENGVAEVDLHIEELIDDFSKYKNHEMLSLQLNYFVKMLDSAITDKLKKIIFIHGAGNGMLKQEIISRLKNNYPDLIYADASMLRYGNGATEIILKNH
ncbi:MAG: DUF2027 domain-containing protein [Bacteroidota bacterium]